MFMTKRKLQLSAAFAALILLAVSLGCSGFFVDPTLTTLTVTPVTPSVVAGSTLQLTATGTYDDGSTKNVSGSVSWSSADATIATVNTSGLMTGVAQGNVVITATSATISGTTNATVQIAGLQTIVLTPSSTSIRSGQTQQYQAIAHLADGSTQDISSSATWTSSDTDLVTIDSSGLATALTIPSTTNITISAQSGTVTATATLTVSP